MAILQTWCIVWSFKFDGSSWYAQPFWLFQTLDVMFAQSLKKKFFFWPPFYIFDFFEENELAALYYFNCDKKKGLLAIDLSLRFSPELICKNLPDMLSFSSFCSHFRIKVASTPGHY